MLLLQLINSQVFGFRYIVGLAGPPGAGKSTVSKEVTKRVNALWLQTNLSVEGESGTTQNDVAIALPMDGFHLYRRQLDMMEVSGFVKCLSMFVNKWVQICTPKSSYFFVLLYSGILHDRGLWFKESEM